jgi:regulator of nonsense transcripts 2
VVTKKAEEFDPEAKAEFDREIAKMINESLESRKFDRKLLFDVPLPVRSKARDPSTTTDSEEQNSDGPPRTMTFSLLTKKGNRQQVSWISAYFSPTCIDDCRPVMWTFPLIQHLL